MLADLHTHTTASDGQLTPAELVTEAIAAGVTTLSITDHDTVAAYAQLPPDQTELKIVPGIELSSRWRNIGIHILGLNIDPTAAAMTTAVNTQQEARGRRAASIATKLTRLGFSDVLNGAARMAGTATIGRPHFARYLVESGQIKSESLAFKKYLGQGKTCDIRENWPEADVVIDWIRAAGGCAVLAHPAKYKLTNMKLCELTEDFKAAGGIGIEVISGQQPPALTDRLARLAARQG